MFNEGLEAPSGHESLPLEKFVKKRDEVIQEVLRVRERHNDNIITALEDTLRQMQMTARIAHSIRRKAARRFTKLLVSALLSVAAPAYMLFRLLEVAAENIKSRRWKRSKPRRLLRFRRRVQSIGVSSAS
ncbi:unnamed protein product [Effrenium voratum]|uniref:Uncharacterized protein n=1 Tax=Effrenium voratum TaxID=2562239 RepID=A0AA36MNK1_9DINO|nr:unnamed protein product [Effrenium voratum]CAJ1421946.1 unnamed protein product [Effrenium voratum]